ncbi:hypothetical protein [Halorubrum sp. DTA98]|uniref:hypothetical protein n=1 Tax=Halorubrum sp. DTA98 TaxID=3402163 RepID=UPI003AAAA9D7
MSIFKLPIAGGVGVTAFLLGSVVGFELLFGPDFPSVFLVLPFATLLAVGAGAASYRLLGRRDERSVYGGLAGLAAFGYGVLLLLLIDYSVPASRDLLTVDRILAVGVALAAVVAVVGWVRPPTDRGREDDGTDRD